jgi:hypothetical protein
MQGGRAGRQPHRPPCRGCGLRKPTVSKKPPGRSPIPLPRAWATKAHRFHKVLN